MGASIGVVSSEPWLCAVAAKLEMSSCVWSPTRRRPVCLPCLQDAAKEEADIAVKGALDAQEMPDVENEVAAAVEKALDEERARVAEVSDCIQEPLCMQSWAAV